MRQRTFRATLTFWFGGLTIGVLLVAGFFLGKLTFDQLTKAQGLALFSKAQAAANQLSTSLRERELEVTLLSQAPHMLRGDWSDPDVQSSLDRRRALRPEYAWVAVVGADGIVQRATDDFLVGQDVSQRSWFVTAESDVHVGDVHEAILLANILNYKVLDGETMKFIDFAAPITPQGQMLGVIAAHVHWDWVWQTALKTMDGHQLGDGVELLILDSDGQVLYPHSNVGAAVVSGRGYIANSAPVNLARWSDGEEYLTASVTVPPTASTGLGWQIVVRQEANAALLTARQLRNLLIALGTLAVVVIILLAKRTALHLAQPLELLTDAARRIEAGETDPAFPRDVSVVEVARLTSSIQSMTSVLLAQERALEQRVHERTAELEAANLELERLATTDPLTGIGNRRYIVERINELMLSRKRGGPEFCLLILDIDYFKKVNDTQGHNIGDEVLKLFAYLVAQSVRGTDFVGRYGGEEFVAVLTGNPTREACLAVAEKIRLLVAQTAFPVPWSVTTSIGVTQSDPLDSLSGEVFKRADRALYEAKGAGRNRVEYAWFQGTSERVT